MRGASRGGVAGTLLALLLVLVLSVRSGGASKASAGLVTCGSVLKLLNTHHKVRLHSHDIKYGSGSGQQSVTGVEASDDANSYWRIRGGSEDGCPRGLPVRCGQAVRLTHVLTGKNLHTHHFPSPLSNNQEVSAFGEDGEGDDLDLWTVRCSGQHWEREASVRFQHVGTSVFLSVTGEQYGNPIRGQHEVHGMSSANAHNTWKAMEGIFIKPGADLTSVSPAPPLCQSPPASMSSAHFNRGPAYGLSAEVKNKLAQKYDHQREQELREWIEGVTGRRIGNNFMDGLKDGIILCEFINKLQPGSVKKVNESTQNWHQLENIGNFIKAITKYGVKPHDIFEANDLFENTNHTQVQSTLLALASMAKTKGNKVNVGVKYAEKQERRFEPEKLREGRNIIGLQMGTNKFASQQGMTAYGTRRHLYDPKLGTDQPLDQATISLQMGTNKGASQAGMTAPGTKRQIFEPGLGMEHCDTLNVSLQMGSNKGASQRGMTVYGLPRQVYDPKYCLTPEYPELGEPTHNHHPHNYYNSA